MRYIGRIIRGTKSRIEKKVKGIKLKSQNQIVIFINCLTKSSIIAWQMHHGLLILTLPLLIFSLYLSDIIIFIHRYLQYYQSKQKNHLINSILVCDPMCFTQKNTSLWQYRQSYRSKIFFSFFSTVDKNFKNDLYIL